MVVYTILDRIRGGISGSDQEPGEPSHVCQTCGERFFLGEDVDIRTCRACGANRVERVE